MSRAKTRCSPHPTAADSGAGNIRRALVVGPVMLDPHAVLGVAPGSTFEVVRRAYKHAVRLHHPDHNPTDPKAADRLRAVVTAYRELEKKMACGAAGSTSHVVVSCRIRGAHLFGALPVPRRAPSDWLKLEIHAVDACGICGGAGCEQVSTSWWRVERFECEVCKGGGIVRVDRRVRVRVPSLTHDETIRLRGLGLARPGDTRGDVYLLVKIT